MPIQIKQRQPDQVGTQVVRQQMARAPNVGGRAINSILGSVSGALQEMGKERNAEAKESAREAALKWSKAKQDLFTNPDTGYMTLTGKTAYDSRGDAVNAIKALRGQFASDLKGPRAVEMFEQAIAPAQLRAIGDINRHASRGFKGWQKETRNLIIQDAVTSAAGLYNQLAVPTPGAPDGAENRLAIEYLKGKAELMDGLDEDGIVGEAREAAVSAFANRYYSSAMTGAFLEGPNAGEQALKGFGDKLSPEVRAKFEAQLKRAREAEAREAERQRNAGVAAAQETRVNDLALSMVGQPASVIEKTIRGLDPSIQGKVLYKYRLYNSLRNRTEGEARVKAYNDARAQAHSPLQVASFIKNNPDAMAAMGPELADKFAKGAVIKTNKVFKAALSTVPFDRLHSLDPAVVRANLDDEDFQEFTEDLQKPRKEYEVQRTMFETIQAQVRSAMEQINGGIPYSDWDDEQRKRAAQAWRSVESGLRAWHRANPPGKKIPNEVLQGLLADAVHPITQTQVGGAPGARKAAEDFGILNALVPATQLWDIANGFFTGKTEHEVGSFFETRTPEQIDKAQAASAALGVPATVENMLFLDNHMDEITANGEQGLKDMAALSYRAKALGHPLSAQQVYEKYKKFNSGKAGGK